MKSTTSITDKIHLDFFTIIGYDSNVDKYNQALRKRLMFCKIPGRVNFDNVGPGKIQYMVIRPEGNEVTDEVGVGFKNQMTIYADISLTKEKPDIKPGMLVIDLFEIKREVDSED